MALCGANASSTSTPPTSIAQIVVVRPDGCTVTDGCYLSTGKTGKLYMLWTSGSAEGNATGIAISESGKLAGPWVQQAEPVFKENGGHAMLFNTFEGKLMMVLHSPYNGETHPHLFEMEDTGNTLRIVKEFRE